MSAHGDGNGERYDDEGEWAEEVVEGLAEVTVTRVRNGVQVAVSVLDLDSAGTAVTSGVVGIRGALGLAWDLVRVALSRP